MKKILFILFLEAIFTLPCLATSTDMPWFSKPLREGFYLLNNSDEFSEFLNLVTQGKSFENDTIIICQDMDFPHVSTASGNFKGTIDGQNHKISGVSRCLFYRNDGTIMNLNLTSGSISGSADVAAICIKNYGSITGCSSSVNVSGSSQDYMYVGGICSYNYGDIVDCINKGSVTCSLGAWSKTVTRCGGIAAYSRGKGIIYCQNIGTIATHGVYSSLTGGISGDLQNGKIIGCTNRGKIVSNIRSATMSDHVTADYKLQYTGGITGQAQINSVINRCRNYGVVSSNFQYVGGIAGQISRTSIYNVVNYGNIISTDGWGYACAAGITGYSHGTYDYYYFYNCINHGNISATAHYDIATSAGISMELTKCYVANCYSDGSVSSTILGGTGNSAFQISQYEYDDCQIMNNAKGVAEANEFISGTQDLDCNLLTWIIQDNKVDFMDSFLSYPIPSHGDCSFYVFPKDSRIYELTITGGVCLNGNNGQGNSPMKIKGLQPGSKYSYTLRDNSGEFTDYGKFSTLSPTFAFSVSDVHYDQLTIHHSYGAQGLDSYSCNLKISNLNTSEFNMVNLNDTVSVLNQFDEETSYALQLKYSLNGKEYSGKIINVTTKTISPEFSLIKSTPYSLRLKCDNYDELKVYNPRIYIESPQFFDYGNPTLGESESFPLDSHGEVTIGNLQYDYSPMVKSEYTFKGERRQRDLGNPFKTGKWGGEGVIQVSKNAAMIHGLFGGLGEKIPDEWNKFSDYKYDSHYFVCRDALEIDSKSGFQIKGACIDGNFDYAVTIPLTSSLFQYYLHMQSSRKYYGKYPEKNGEWKLIDASAPTVDIVEPRFYAARFVNNTISFSFIDGEELTDRVFLQYKVENASQFHSICLSNGPGTKELSKPFSTLVPELSYLFRFNSTTSNGKIYYSKTYRLRNGVLEEATDIPPILVSGISISESGVYLKEGEIVKLFAVIMPEDATNTAVTWETSDSNVATVNADGIVMAIKKGEVIITVKSVENPNVYATCMISISEDTGISSVNTDSSVIIETVGTNIYIRGVQENSEVKIYNEDGMLVFQGLKRTIDNLNHGFYVLKIESKIFKIVI